MWGNRRVAAGISIRQLSQESGVHRGLLTLMEHGRMVPTSAEYDRIESALSRLTRSLEAPS